MAVVTETETEIASDHHSVKVPLVDTREYWSSEKEVQGDVNQIHQRERLRAMTTQVVPWSGFAWWRLRRCSIWDECGRRGYERNGVWRVLRKWAEGEDESDSED